MKTRPVTTVVSEGLAPLIDEANALRTAYRRRKDENDYVILHVLPGFLLKAKVFIRIIRNIFDLCCLERNRYIWPVPC
jgi:hypothetical protein